MPNLVADNHPLNSESDQPRVVEIIKNPENLVQLELVNNRKFRDIEKKKYGKVKLFIYQVRVTFILLEYYLDRLMRDLCNLCMKTKRKEIIKEIGNINIIMKIIFFLLHR